jgi:hypothetical protein
MRRLWLWFLARFRLSDYAICEMSKGRGPRDDFHDYPDAETRSPIHMTLLRCSRCGKGFYI